MPRRVIIPNPKSPDEKPARKQNAVEVLKELVRAIEKQNKTLELIANNLYAIDMALR